MSNYQYYKEYYSSIDMSLLYRYNIENDTWDIYDRAELNWRDYFSTTWPATQPVFRKSKSGTIFFNEISKEEMFMELI